MNVLGLTITRTKAAVPATTMPSNLSTPESRGGWYPLIREGFTGAWQRNIETPLVDVLSHPTVFACITLIASDVAKTRLELVRQEANDVWVSTENPAFSPVLRSPNGFQVPFQIKEQWLISKLESGNAYVLKQRDQRGVVVALHVLDPWKVKPLVSPDGSVFYELRTDRLAQVGEDTIVVPAREIIHDRFNTLFHPLVGVSPLYACGIAAILGTKIQTNSAHFFSNGAQPGGILTAPGQISDETAKRLKAQWEAGYGGINAGRVAVVGDDLKYQALAQPANESQLNEQWLSASRAIADAFHVPWYLVGGPMPPYNNIQALNVQYYTQCLQPLMTQFEDVLEDGLGLGEKINGVRYGVQFMVADLLWMDSATSMQVIRDGVGSAVLSPNEGRARINLQPVEGGNTPYLQQQNYSLAALDKRDSMAPAPPTTPAPTAAPAAEADDADEVEDVSAAFAVRLSKALEIAA